MDTPQGRIQNILTITNCNCNYAIVCHMLLIIFIYLKTCCKYKSQLHSGHRLPNRRIHERIFFTFFSYISNFYPYYKQQTILLNFLISRKKHKHIDKFKSQNALGFENVRQSLLLFSSSYLLVLLSWHPKPQARDLDFIMHTVHYKLNFIKLWAKQFVFIVRILNRIFECAEQLRNVAEDDH